MMLAPLASLDKNGPAFFRFREVGGKVLVTNYEGEFLLLDPTDFTKFSTGAVEQGSELHAKLRDKNFLRGEYRMEQAVERYRLRKRHVKSGPNLHLMIVTLRCNETCVYCHASRANMDAVQTDMTKETAEKAVELALSTTSDWVTIEFQGGEPLVNYPVVQHIIQYALERNKTIGKHLEFTMVSNLALMDEEKLAFLLEHKVQLCTSIDGTRDLHDKQRRLPNLSAFDAATYWIKRINEAYAERGLDTSLYHVEALLTTTKETLERWKEVVDTYVTLGCRAIFLRPVDPFGFADRTQKRVEYPRKEYLDFYRQSVDYMIELNKSGVQVLERYAAIFLTKILAGVDPNFLDIRSPGGAGLGQLAYNYDGKIFSSDEGRMLHEMGDSAFHIGDVRTSGYRDIVGHPTVRALCMASNLDAQPDCVNCAYNPFCGTSPEYNHKTQGTFFGRMRESNMCAVHKGIQDYLFEKLATADQATLEILERWTTVRPREHYVHPAGAAAAE